MVPVQRLSFATLVATDLERSIAYFRETTGFHLAAREGDGAFFATEMGRLAIELRRGGTAGLARLSFEMAMEVDEAARTLRALGVESRIRSDPFPGARRALSFLDPCGTEIELFSGTDFLSSVPFGVGVKPLKLGHVARFCSDLPKVIAFYEKVLGFRVSDWVGDYFVFLRCDADHHAVNFFRGPVTQLHHMAFELKDMAHMQSACDALASARIPVGWGPLRQSAGHNMAVYHRSDDGHAVEYYCELDQMKSELLGYFDPKPWHEDHPQRPKVWDPSSWEAGWGTPPAPHFGRSKHGAELKPGL